MHPVQSLQRHPSSLPCTWLVQKGETAKLIAGYDWSSTPLGELATWPQALRSSVNLMLEAGAPMALIWGQEFRFLYNDAYSQIIQDKHPAAMGAPGAQIFPELWSNIVPLFEKALSGEAVVIEDYALKLTRRGETKEGFFSFSYNPVRGERGRVEGFLAVVLETTARVIHEQERAQAFETTLSTIADFAYSFDRQGRFIFVNKALLDLWGLPLEDAVGKNFFELNYPPELAARLQRQIDQVFTTKKPLLDETPYVSPAGVEGYYEYIFNPVIGPDGEVTIVAGSTRDVTKRKALERTLSATIKELELAKQGLQAQAVSLESDVQERTAKLQESITQLETFSYSISHDLRGPLRAMQSYARIIEEESGRQMTDENQTYLRRIIAAADRMDRLIQDVLIYSRLSHGTLALEPVDLAKLLNDILETYPQFHRPSSNVQVSLPLPTVLGNEAALTQCFSNLFGNAVKFVASGVIPKIEVWSESDNRSVTVFVKDNGIGIDPSLHDKIFEMFQQLDTQREGTGIGLAVAKRAVERMGGKIEVSSRPGIGSTFAVNLPLARL